MKNLANHINGTEDVFTQSTEEQGAIVKEYYERNERKKDDDKWLKANKSKVMGILTALGKDKADFGDIRASYTVPDKSGFDNDKIMEYLIANGLDEQGTKRVVDEDAIAVMIEQGIIDMEVLKEHAWVERQDSPRLTVKQVKKK